MSSSEERKEPVIIDRVFMVIAEFGGEVFFWRGHPHEAAALAKLDFEHEYVDEIEDGTVKFLKVVEVTLNDALEVADIAK